MSRSVIVKRNILIHLLLLNFVFSPLLKQTIAQSDFYSRFADSALSLTQQHVIYDPAYVQLDYPNGDVPANKGVCTDVVIRTYRKMGIDLQKEVHEDMKVNFELYPDSLVY